MKSAAYWQSWPQQRPLKIVFRIPRTWGWNAEDDSQCETPTRAADLYVFAVLSHLDKATIDPLDVSQWDFDGLPTAVLERNCAEQQTVALGALLRYAPNQVKYDGRRGAVAEAVNGRPSIALEPQP